jgi:hypothetical protein
MGTTELAGEIGSEICECEVGAGATVARAFGRAGKLRASEGTSRLKVRTTLTIAASVATA